MAAGAVLNAIRIVAAGGAVFGPDIASRMIAYFAAERPPAEPDDPAYAELSGREKEILTFLAKNATNAAIAAALGLSAKTIANYVTNIFNELQAEDRIEARRITLRWRLGAEE
ncbi:LuxR C-terminal-related transcriptional regulator [Paenibacillus sp. TRM 82003]|nr:LuxR C-terminal-related transcriptional regulator [Paenibacillus sp. TRM 82003]